MSVVLKIFLNKTIIVGRFSTEGSFSGALFFYILLQVFHIQLKGVDALFGDLANRLRIVVLELFDHFQIPGFFQLLNLHAEVARCSAGLFPDKGKFRFFYADEERHYGQAQL
jgi:hypothetical protein